MSAPAVVDMRGKAALVSGGASGIGRACALMLARAGARVVVSDLAPEGGEAVVADIRAGGGEAHFVQADVADEGQVRAMVAQTVALFGRLDCAVNSAGLFGRIAPLEEQSLADVERVLGINLTGVFLCMKYQLEAMLENRSGAIVNIASIQGLVSGPGAAIYSASKHGVIGMSKGAAMDHARSGVRINVVCPGTVETPLARKYYAERGLPLPNDNSRIPMARVGQPDEVAAAAVFLCSDAASYMTGVCLPVDGGVIVQ